MEYVIIALSVIIGGFILSLIIVPFFVYHIFFSRRKDEVMIKNSMKDEHYNICKDMVFEYKKKLDNVPFKEISIKSFDGLNLYGKYYDNSSNILIIMFHGVRAVKEYSFAYQIINLLDLGYNILLVDQRAHFKSEGDFISYGLYEKEDIRKWVEYFDNNDKIQNIFLDGISMGGTSVALASNILNDKKKVKGLIINCAYTNTYDLTKYLLSTMHTPSFLVLPGVALLLKIRKGLSLKSVSTIESLKQTKIPCLFIEGKEDKVVPLNFVMQNYNACASEKDLYLVEKAGHATSIPVAKEEGIKKLNEFITKYI